MEGRLEDLIQRDSYTVLTGPAGVPTLPVERLGLCQRSG